MESIERLREWVDNNCCLDNAEVINDRLDAIEQEVDEMWHALTIDAKPMTDENMAESGWVRLPVDADGVPIHVGDVMEWRYGNGEFEVIGTGGCNTLFYIDKDSNECEWTAASDKRHNHHATTVEDVLREFYVLAVRGKEAHAEDVDADVLTEYAAKLRLAGEDE